MGGHFCIYLSNVEQFRLTCRITFSRLPLTAAIVQQAGLFSSTSHASERDFPFQQWKQFRADHFFYPLRGCNRDLAGGQRWYLIPIPASPRRYPGENALARGLPQGCLTIGSSGWISMGVVGSHARRKLFAIRRFAGRSGYFWVTSVKAKARPMVMLGTAFGYCSFKEYNLSVR